MSSLKPAINQIARQFKKNLSHYQQEARVQKEMAEKILELVKEKLSQPRRILELGAGSGLLSKKLSEAFPKSRFFLNELVDTQEEILTTLVPDGEFVPGDMLDVPWPPQLDLVIANAAIQWVENLPLFFRKAAQSLASGGVLALTSFGPENYKEIRSITGRGLSYRSLSEWEQFFEQDFVLLYRQEETKTLYFPTPLAVFRHMKATGVNSLGPESSTLWLPPLLLAYEQFLTPQGYPLTYQPQYLLAQRK